MPKISLDFSHKFLRPELLQHPPIPRALLGINPRRIMGQEEWDKVRRKVYAKNNFCCWSCGSSGQLHAHEAYEYDVEQKTAILDEIVGLCVSCHRFVHILQEHAKLMMNAISKEEFLQILNHGLTILKSAQLKPHWATEAIRIWCLPWARKSSITPRAILVGYLGIDKSLIDAWFFNFEWKLIYKGKQYDWTDKINPKGRR